MSRIHGIIRSTGPIVHVDQICPLGVSLCGVDDEAVSACANNICICSLQCELTIKVGTVDELERSVLFLCFGQEHEGAVSRAFDIEKFGWS